MLPTYMKKVDDTLYFKGDGELIYYIPEKYFDTNNAITIGEYVETMGVFNYDVFDKSGKAKGIRLFEYPTMIKCKPTSMTKENSLLLKGTHTEIPYRLLHFKDGSELVCSTKLPQSVINSEKFINLLFRANLPENIPYDKLHELIAKNADINGVKYNVTNQLMGAIVSELCRDPKDLSKPFRLSKETDMTAYKMIPITQIPKYISPYTSVTSENADEAIANAIELKDKHINSPLEKVVMN